MKLLSILIGFGTIGLIASVFAKMQGIIYPLSMDLFTGQADDVQLLIKLMCVYCSCVIGGMVTTRIGGCIRESIIVGVVTVLVIGWLWMSAKGPSWFWLLLMLGGIPAVLTGRKIIVARRGR